MKTTIRKNPGFRTGCGILLAVLAGVTIASAQSSNVPGPTDYSRFATFITQRNIFDPNRYPLNSRPRITTTFTRTRTRSSSAPAFTLVGTMSYEKGMFAFFDGNSSELRKALPVSGSIAGYNVAEITLTGVKLQTADKKETVQMKIGEAMQQEGTAWRLAGQGNFSGSGVSESEGSSSIDNSNPSPSAAPSPALEGNDILKKLMQQRQQELK